MSGLARIKRKVKLSVLSAVVSGLLITPVLAGVVEISAEFVPDPSNPGSNKFINKTPASGYCAAYPTVCIPRNIFSLESSITAESNAPIRPSHSQRKGPMFQIPAQWRDVEVLHESGTQSETVELRVTSLGTTYRLSQRAQELIGRPEDSYLKSHGILWGREAGW